jgi:hypothetical protein
MAVYVDALRDWGWKLGPSCHLITDGPNEELHGFAARLGLKRSWFQASPSGPHYDLVASKRRLAVKLGAIELNDRSFHAILKDWIAHAISAIEAAQTEEEKRKVREYLYR